MGNFFLTGRLFIAATIVFMFTSTTQAYERFTTTARLIRGASYVAHVRVNGGRRVPGAGHVREYRLTVLENFKGKLSHGARVRIPVASRIVQPNGKPDPAGSEWIVILGRKTSAGVYPLRSLKWGKIEIYIRESTGQKMLARRLTGMGRGLFSLARFRATVKR